MSATATQKSVLDTDDRMIGGLFVGAIFIAVTAAIYTYISSNTTFFNDNTVTTILKEVVLGLLFLFIIAIAANYKALDFIQDHAVSLLIFSYVTMVLLLSALFILPGLLMVFLGQMLGLILVILGAGILFLAFFRWSSIKARLELAGEWLTVAATVVLNEPGMIVISIIQSIIIGISVITEFFSIYAWNAYTGQNNIGNNTATFVFYLISFIYLWFSFFVIYFFDGTNTVVAYSRIKGNDPKIGQGVNAASKTIISLLAFALLSTTVVFITNLIRGAARRNYQNTSQGRSGNQNIGSAIFFMMLVAIANFAEWIYHLLSFFTLPAIVLRRKSMPAAMGESKDLFSKHAWNVIISDMGFSFGSMIMYLVTAFILAVCGFFYGYFVASAGNSQYQILWGVGLAILALIFGLAITKFFLRPLYTTFVTTIYVYASEGPTGLKNISTKLTNQIDKSLQSPRAQPRGMPMM